MNTYLAVAQKLDPETRIERARHIKDLLEHPGWAVFSEILEASLVPARRAVEGWDGVQPYEQIASRQGYLRGLTTASLIPEAIVLDGQRAETQQAQIVAAMESRNE